MAKRHSIGLGHLTAICQMREEERLSLLEEGLPLILESAEGFRAGAEMIKSRPREADVLDGFAVEEAAKVLILIDMLRCPNSKRSQQVGTFVRWFYDHLARLIYAEALSWRPTDKSQLRSYVDSHRRSHTTDGAVGEYIVPSGPVPNRERRLYADVERLDDGSLTWNAPRSWKDELTNLPFFDRVPDAIRVARAMQKLGMFSMAGMKVVSEVWGAEPLSDAMRWQDSRDLTLKMLKSLENKGAILDGATNDHARLLLERWPLPMWDFELSPIVVPLEQLEAERERNLWNEAGY